MLSVMLHHGLETPCSNILCPSHYSVDLPTPISFTSDIEFLAISMNQLVNKAGYSRGIM